MFTVTEKKLIRQILTDYNGRKSLGNHTIATVRNQLRSIKVKIEGGESLNGVFAPTTGLKGDITGIMLLYIKFLEHDKMGENLCLSCSKSLDDNVYHLDSVGQCFVCWLESKILALKG